MEVKHLKTIVRWVEVADAVAVGNTVVVALVDAEPSPQSTVHSSNNNSNTGMAAAMDSSSNRDRKVT
jgi:hypothetical protein